MAFFNPFVWILTVLASVAIYRSTLIPVSDQFEFEHTAVFQSLLQCSKKAGPAYCFGGHLSAILAEINANFSPSSYQLAHVCLRRLDVSALHSVEMFLGIQKCFHLVEMSTLHSPEQETKGSDNASWILVFLPLYVLVLSSVPSYQQMASTLVIVKRQFVLSIARRFMTIQRKGTFFLMDIFAKSLEIMATSQVSETDVAHSPRTSHSNRNLQSGNVNSTTPESIAENPDNLHPAENQMHPAEDQMQQADDLSIKKPVPESSKEESIAAIPFPLAQSSPDTSQLASEAPKLKPKKPSFRISTEEGRQEMRAWLEAKKQFAAQPEASNTNVPKNPDPVVRRIYMLHHGWVKLQEAPRAPVMVKPTI